MIHEKILKINTIMPATADKKLVSAQALVDYLDEDNLAFLAKLCREKAGINNTIRNNSKTLESAIKAL